MKASARKIHLAADVDLMYIAERTEGFSGADLQALVYNAHLSAVHEVMEIDKSTEMSVDPSLSLSNSIQYTTFGTGAFNATQSVSQAERAQMMQKVCTSDLELPTLITDLNQISSRPL